MKPSKPGVQPLDPMVKDSFPVARSRSVCGVFANLVLGLFLALAASNAQETPSTTNLGSIPNTSPAFPPLTPDFFTSTLGTSLDSTTPDPASESTLSPSVQDPSVFQRPMVRSTQEGYEADFSWLDAPSADPGSDAVIAPVIASDRFRPHLPSEPGMELELKPPPQGTLPVQAQQFPVQSLDNQALGNLQMADFPPPRQSIRIGSNRVRYGGQINAGVSYNNNVFGAAKNPQGDVELSLQPTVVLEAGTKHTVRVIYAPSILKYVRFKQFDSLNQNFLFSARLRGNKVRVGLDAAYLTQSGLFLSSEGQAKQQSLFSRLFVEYPLTGKTGLLLTAEGNHISSDPGISQSRFSLAAAIDYRYSQKTSVGAGITLGYYSLPGGTIRYQELLLRLRYAPTAKLTITAEGGIQFRQAEETSGGSYSTSTSIINASIAYQATTKTLLTFRFFRNVSVDAFVPDSMLVLTGVQAGLKWLVFERAQVDGTLVSGYAENSTLSGTEASSYFFNQGTLSLTYFPRPTVSLRVFTSVQQRLRDSMENNYISNISGMGMGVGF